MIRSTKLMSSWHDHGVVTVLDFFTGFIVASVMATVLVGSCLLRGKWSRNCITLLIPPVVSVFQEAQEKMLVRT